MIINQNKIANKQIMISQKFREINQTIKKTKINIMIKTKKIKIRKIITRRIKK